MAGVDRRGSESPCSDPNGPQCIQDLDYSGEESGTAENMAKHIVVRKLENWVLEKALLARALSFLLDLSVTELRHDESQLTAPYILGTWPR
jgi:hypothetical protein